MLRFQINLGHFGFQHKSPAPSPGRPVQRLRWLVVGLLALAIILAVTSRTEAQANPIPTPLTPASGTITTVSNYPPVALPDFSWTEVTGATQYRIQISQDIGFVTRLEFTTPLTEFLPTNTGQFADGLWYWRVRVDAPVDMVSDYSIIMSFTKQWADPSNFPVLNSPANGATLEFYDPPTFSWDPVVGAGQYRFQIASSPDFITLVYNQNTLAVTHQPKNKLSNGVYYWRVIPVDPGNREGTPSQVRSFTQAYNQVPVLLAPLDVNNPAYDPPVFTPTFRWSAVQGAQFYRLQYTSDPTCDFDAAGTATIDTANTTYTPNLAFPNDVNYCWRVRTHSGSSISNWSDTWEFTKQWYIQPVLLTPTNNFQRVRFPLFSWTPVPGASKYRLEYSTSPDFSTGTVTRDVVNTFYTPEAYNGADLIYYWRVTPLDGGNNLGKTSSVWSFRSEYDELTPHQIYPHYYYIPNNFPLYPGVGTNPYEDRTIPLPIFMWQRVTLFTPFGGTFPGAYRVQVSTDPLFFTVNWDFETENLTAVPTTADPFTPVAGTNYYWRVRPLASLGGSEIGNWSQTWLTRVDLSQGLTPTTGSSPQLMRPNHAAEFVELTPLMEWWPLQGADSYDVQISTAAGFGGGDIVVSTNVPYPAFAPTSSLAERHLGRTDYGTYYWRVRAVSGGTPGAWSTTRRFQIASQTEWLRTRAVGHTENQLPIYNDPSGDIGDSNFDLTGLYATQSADSWFFSFDATSSGADMVYALYLDRNHADGYGATSDPRGYSVSTIDAHRPEYALYVFQTNNEFYPDDVFLYAWDDGTNTWNPPQSLVDIGGEIFPVDFNAVDMLSTSDGWAVGDFGNIVRWGGSSWSRIDSPTFEHLNAVGMATAIHGWAGGDNGKLLKWDGLSWASVASPTPYDIHAAHMVSDTLGWLADDFGRTYTWNGMNWSNRATPNPSNYPLYGIHAYSNNLAFAVGYFGRVFRWDGSNWNDQSGTTFLNLYDVEVVSPTKAIAVGELGVILEWNGATWSSVTSPTSEDLFGIAMVAGGTDGWIVGDNGTMLRWNGSTWVLQASPTDNPLYGVDLTSATNVMAVGERGADYRWNGSSWSPNEDPIAKFIELRIPNTAIGMQEETATYGVSLFSVPLAGGSPQDSVPSDPNVPGSGVLSRFATASERLMLRYYPSKIGTDPTKLPSVLLFFVEYPTGSFGTAPWAGFHLKVFLDEQFTTEVGQITVDSNAAYYATPFVTFSNDIQGDNTYYWRVRPRYRDPLGVYQGAWSQGRPLGTEVWQDRQWRFERFGFKAQNLQTSVTFATPTFSWDMVEGAKSYDLMVDDDPSFQSPVVNVGTPNVSFTPQGTLPAGTYHWRVRVRREGNITNDWTSPITFTLSLPVPTGLTPNDPGAVNVEGYAPTFCWDPLVVEANGDPVLAAWRYIIQVSRDPTFSTTYDNDSTEQTCWTPIKGYDDGLYYWRVAMLDGNSRQGDYSAVAEFTKQYPVTTLLAPLDGSVLSTTPTFDWTEVDGAATYRLEVSTNSNFTPLYDSIDTHNTAYIPNRVYNPGVTYYWRVAIKDANGKIGPFTDATLIFDPLGMTEKVFLPMSMR